MPTSSTQGQKNRSFIGFYVDSALKEQVESQAEEAGTSISEWMRQQLNDLTDAADQRVATA